MLLCLIFFVDCTKPYLALLFLILFGMLFAGMVSGSYTAGMSVAPEFSGTIESLCGSFGMAAYIICQMLFGVLIKNVSLGV